MEIKVDARYLRAEISYGKLVRCMWRQNKKRTVLQSLCHEICHILAPQGTEATVEHISRLLFKLYGRR
jgi:hypothetical protein